MATTLNHPDVGVTLAQESGGSDDLVQFLLRPGCYPEGTNTVDLVETHI